MTTGGTWDRKIWERIRQYFVPSQNAIRTKNVNNTQFGEDLVASRTPIIELNSSYGTSLIRDKITEENGGTVESTEGIIRLSTTDDPDSKVTLESSEIGRYMPGYGSQLGMGVRCTCEPEGDTEILWGGWTANQQDGFFFGVDSVGKFVATKRDGIVNKDYQEDWNIDKLDGTGNSGYTLDVNNGVIYQIEFTWYGYGQILFGVVGINGDGQQRFIPCHFQKDFTQTSIISPNLRLVAQIDNAGQTNEHSIDIGGRQYSIVGKYTPILRINGDWRSNTTVGTTVVPLISFRQKSGFLSRSIKALGFDAVDVTDSMIFEIRSSGTVTGGEWVDLTNQNPNETSVEVNKTATGISGGVIIWTGIIGADGPGSQRGSTRLDLDIDIPEGQVVSLCARTFTGSGTVRSAFRVTEEW